MVLQRYSNEAEAAAGHARIAEETEAQKEARWNELTDGPLDDPTIEGSIDEAAKVAGKRLSRGTLALA